jgi:phage baseplate assembly protein W
MSNRLSDYNSNTNVPSRNVGRASLYADLNSSFIVHPILRDIRPVTDIDAVKSSVRNLVMTSYRDRPFHPEIGTNISRLLFETANVFTAMSLRQEIEHVLATFESRVADVTVQVVDDSERNAYLITIGFRVTFAQESLTEVSFYLNRIR